MSTKDTSQTAHDVPPLAHEEQSRLAIASLAIGQPSRVEAGWHRVCVRDFGIWQVLQVSH
jgi:hypothetical protein